MKAKFLKELNNFFQKLENLLENEKNNKYITKKDLEKLLNIKPIELNNLQNS